MLAFRKLDVYRAALEALPLAYAIAECADVDTKRQIKRAALSINLNIAEGAGRRWGDDQRQFFRIARGSALEVAAAMDALEALRLVTRNPSKAPSALDALDALLERIVAMLTKMIERAT